MAGRCDAQNRGAICGSEVRQEPQIAARPSGGIVRSGLRSCFRCGVSPCFRFASPLRGVRRCPEPHASRRVQALDAQYAAELKARDEAETAAKEAMRRPAHWKQWAGFLSTETQRPGIAKSRSNCDASDSHQDSPSHRADAAELLQASRNASADSPHGAEDAGIGWRASQTVARDALSLRKDSHNPSGDARRGHLPFMIRRAHRHAATQREPPQPEIEQHRGSALSAGAVGKNPAIHPVTAAFQKKSRGAPFSMSGFRAGIRSSECRGHGLNHEPTSPRAPR